MRRFTQHHYGRGYTLIQVLVGTVLIAAAVGAGRFIIDSLELFPQSPATQKETNSPQKIAGLPVLKSVKFKDSQGNKKAFVIVQANQGGTIPVADVYMTDDKLTPESAVKIQALSGDSSLGYAASSIPIAGARLSLSVSGDSGRKIIAMLTSIDDGAVLTLVSEDGQIVSDKIAAALVSELSDKCPCRLVLGDWQEEDQLILKITAQNGQVYQAQIDAKNGLVREIKQV